MKADSLSWNGDRFGLNHKEIDDTHQEFVSLVNACIVADKTQFCDCLKKLLEHTELHFSREEAKMLEHGDPSIAEHKAEHMRVLGELNNFLQRVEKGNTMMAKAYIRERLPEWFALHTSTMDSALVAHIAKQQNSTC